MRTYITPAVWDGAKFAQRYGLSTSVTNPGFVVKGDGTLVVYDESKITDDPPIFEAPGPRPKSLEERITALEARVGIAP